MEIVRLENTCLFEKNGSGIENLSLSVEQGQIWGILGTAGAGKTALCRLLTGREKPDDGLIHRESEGLSRRGVAYVPAGVRLRTGMRCARLIAALGAASGIHADYSWILEQCGRFGLQPNRKTRRLNASEQKRLALLSAVQRPSALLVLDEPSLTLEYSHRARFFSLLQPLQDEGAGIVFTTRSVEEVRRYATHALILDGGRTLAQGSVEELRCLSAVGVTLQLAEDRAAECMMELGVANYTNLQGTIRFFYGGSTDALVQSLSHWPVARLEIREPDLESVMKACRTGGRTQEYAHSMSY